MNDAPPPSIPFTPGQVLGGKYRVLRVIGEGGMGVVAEAVHVELDERVALKFLRPEMLTAPDVVARFDREARSAVKLKSDHVARVTDVGKTDAGVPYMVMEYLDGKDLGDTLSERGPLPITEAVEYIIQACEGIGEAHARGIVHRDVKPENLFLVQRDDGWRSVKVLDFGISKAVLVGTSSVNVASSQTTSIMGSPYYMSPEQLRSTKSVDHRADVWSLGVVLFELLTGTMPFDETLEFTELVAMILESPQRRLRAYRPDAPPQLEAVVDRALEKDRARRFQSTAELAVALLPFAPKRARAMAERATSISKAAGLSDPSFQIPPSDLPPPSAGAEAMIPIGTVGAPRVPQMTPVSSPSTPRISHSTPSIGGSVETVAPPTSATWQRVAIGAGAVALLALGSILAIGVHRFRSAGATTVQTAPDAPRAAPIAATTAAATEAAKPVRRVLVVEPRDAVVTIDGVRVTKQAPWIEGTTTTSRLLHAEAPGYRPRDLTVTFDNDDPVVVELEREHGSAATTPHVAHMHPPAIAAPPSASGAQPPPQATASPTDVGY